MNETKTEKLHGSVYAIFFRYEFTWDEISQLSYEECVKKGEIVPLNELEEVYNSYDTDCKDTEDYIRIFSSSDICYHVYMIFSDDSKTIELGDGTKCTLSGQWITIGEEDFSLSEVPTEILEELYMKTSLIEKTDLMGFEKRFAEEDFPLYVTIRESVDNYCMTDEPYYLNPDYEIVDEDGTIRIHKTLYDDFESSGNQITASLRGCMVMIIKHSAGMDGIMESICRLEDIPADLLMKSLSTTDCFEMMNMLKERYNNWYSYNEILVLLNKDNIPFHETKDFCSLGD